MFYRGGELMNDAMASTAVKVGSSVHCRNVRCRRCSAMHWVATNVSVMACEHCGEAIEFKIPYSVG